MVEQLNDQTVREAERALGEPVLPEFSEDLRRTKRNLLIVSGFAIFTHLSGIQITEAGFLGFKFSNPDQIWLHVGVLSVVAYLFIQFCWRAWDYIQLTRLRITGTRLSHVTTGIIASEYGDYPNNPNQSTLYNWWRGQAKKIGNLSELADEIHRVASRLEEVAKQPGNMEMPNINHVNRAASEIRNEISKLENRLVQVEKTITSARIPVSLEKFDRWFCCFAKSQILRILLLDLAFPFVFGASAIVLWGMRIICFSASG